MPTRVSLAPKPVARKQYICSECAEIFASIEDKAGVARFCNQKRHLRKLAIKTQGIRFQSQSPEYRVWSSLKSRCLNPENPLYGEYGGRGITFHAAWAKSFDAFLADVGRRPEDEYIFTRRDSTRGYEPGNVHWVLSVTQASSRKNNVRIDYDGKSMTLAEWGREVNLSPNTIKSRIKAGWTLEQVFNPHRAYHVRKAKTYRM